eukprot:365164-Chlamydomonas_euryale.AAC.7
MRCCQSSVSLPLLAHTISAICTRYQVGRTSARVAARAFITDAGLCGLRGVAPFHCRACWTVPCLPMVDVWGKAPWCTCLRRHVHEGEGGIRPAA